MFNKVNCLPWICYSKVEIEKFLSFLKRNYSCQVSSVSHFNRTTPRCSIITALLPLITVSLHLSVLFIKFR